MTTTKHTIRDGFWSQHARVFRALIAIFSAACCYTITHTGGQYGQAVLPTLILLALGTIWFHTARRHGAIEYVFPHAVFRICQHAYGSAAIEARSAARAVNNWRARRDN